MKTSLYRLGEYKIIVHDIGELSWESHFGFGEMQEGRCFKKGAILFIGPSENTRLSYLKLEYLDHIKNLPEWEKTEYYCTSNEIYHCDTGKRVSEGEMELWKYDTGRASEKLQLKTRQDELDASPFSKSAGHETFRLNRFKIMEKVEGRFFWTSYSGRTTGKSGACTILEDILFIGPSENVQPGFDKQEFLSALNKLQKWNQTKYYCPKYILHKCKKQNLPCGVTKNRSSYGTEAEKQFREGQNRAGSGEDNQNLSGSNGGHAGLKSKTLNGASNDTKWLSFAAGIFLVAILMILLFLVGPRNEQRAGGQKEHPSRYRTYR